MYALFCPAAGLLDACCRIARGKVDSSSGGEAFVLIINDNQSIQNMGEFEGDDVHSGVRLMDFFSRFSHLWTLGRRYPAMSVRLQARGEGHTC